MCKEECVSPVEFVQVSIKCPRKRHSRRPLGVTQAQFADCWDTSLVTSLEVGRRAITERSRREIAHIFAEEVCRAPDVQKTAVPLRSGKARQTAAPGVVRPLTLLQLFVDLRGLRCRGL